MENETYENINKQSIWGKLLNKKDSFKFDLSVSFLLTLLLSYSIFKGSKIINVLYFKTPTGNIAVVLKLLITGPLTLIYYPASLLFSKMGESALGLAILLQLAIPFYLIIFWTLTFFLIAKLFRLLKRESIILRFAIQLLFVIIVSVFIVPYQAEKSEFINELETDPYTKAITQQNFELCNEEENIAKRDICFFNFADLNHKNASMEKEACSYIEDGVVRLVCNARKKNLVTREECETLKNASSQIIRKDDFNTCLLTYVYYNSDVNICNLPEFLDIKESCIKEVALGTKNETLCAGLHDDQIKNNCYTYLATALKDYNLCYKMIENYEKVMLTKETCIRLVAEETSDPSLCNLIKKGDVQYQLCKDRVS